jgi:hypothetical protein
MAITLTNDQAGICILASQEILRDLLTAIIGATTANDIITGEDPITVPGGTTLVGKHIAVKATYDASPETFVASQGNVNNLDDVADEITALAVEDFAARSGDAYDQLQLSSPEA